MITIYSATETAFTSLGLGALVPISCPITEDINGQYELYMEHPIDENGKWKHLVNDRIIKAPTHDGDQLFRIYSAVMNPITGRIDVNARHIFYDLLDNLIEDTRPTVKDGEEAGEAILDGCQYETPFTFESDIEDYSTAYYIRVNPVKAFIGSGLDQSFINRWGGEIRRNNFAISINERRGSDKGVRIAYGKNLTGLEATEDISSVYTRIMPTALDASNAVIYTAEKYYDLSLINNYAHPKIGILDTGIVVGQEVEGVVSYPDEDTAKTAMEAMAAAAFEAGADKPKLTINVSFVRWQDTDEYKAYSELYTLEMGDNVTVDYAPLDLTYDLRVTSIVWDSVLNKAVSLTLGDLEPNIAQSVVDVGIDLSALRQDTNLGVSNINNDLSNLSNDVAGKLDEGQAYNNVTITNEDGLVTTAVIGGKTITVKQNSQTGFAIFDGATYVGGVKVVDGKVLFIGNAVETTAVIGEKTITAKMNPTEGFSVYDGTTFIGGLKIIDGEAVLVSNRLTNDVYGDCYAKIGEFEEGGITYNGIFIYKKISGAFELIGRIAVTDYGYLSIKTEAGAEMLLSSGITIRDASGKQRVSVLDNSSATFYGEDGVSSFICSSLNLVLKNSSDINVFFSDASDTTIKSSNGNTYARLSNERALVVIGTQTRIDAASGWTRLYSPNGNYGIGVDNSGAYKLNGATKTYI